MSDPTVTAFLAKLLCAEGGCLVRSKLPEYLTLSPEQIDQILQDESKRFPVCGDLVLARSSVRICPLYLKNEQEEEDCGKLHLCRHYLQGKCWPGRKPPCRFSHNVQSDHNRAVLKDNDISGLNEEEVKVLLQQNDHSLLPEVCFKYLNSTCDQDGCSRLHTCHFFTQGKCYRYLCKKSHNLLEPTDLLKCRLPLKSIQNFQMLCVLKCEEAVREKRDQSRSGEGRGPPGASRGRGALENNKNDGLQDQSKDRKWRRKRHGAGGRGRRGSSNHQVEDNGMKRSSTPERCNGLEEQETFLADFMENWNLLKNSSSDNTKEEESLDPLPSVRPRPRAKKLSQPINNKEKTSSGGDVLVTVPHATSSSIQPETVGTTDKVTKANGAAASTSQKSNFVSTYPDIYKTTDTSCNTQKSSSVSIYPDITHTTVASSSTQKTTPVHLNHYLYRSTAASSNVQKPPSIRADLHSNVSIIDRTNPPLTEFHPMYKTIGASSSVQRPTSVRADIHSKVSTIDRTNSPVTDFFPIYKTTSSSSSLQKPTSVRADKPENVSTMTSSSVQKPTSVRADKPENVSTMTSSSVQKPTSVRADKPGNVSTMNSPIAQSMTSYRSNPLVTEISAASSDVQKPISVSPSPDISVTYTVPSRGQQVTSTAAGMPVNVPTASSSTAQQITGRQIPVNVEQVPSLIGEILRDEMKPAQSTVERISSTRRKTPVSAPTPIPLSVQSITSTEGHVPANKLTPNVLPIISPTKPTPSAVPCASTPPTTTKRNVPDKKPEVEDIREICLHHIWKYCRLGNCCSEMHYHFPYRWQVFTSTKWKDFTDMEKIEKAFCDPKIDRISLLDFQTMKGGTRPIRRLSTASSVTRPADYVLTTEWLWYWQDELGSWIPYGNMNTKQVSGSISSSSLENIYQANPKETVPFQAGQQRYQISFIDMIQKNLVYQTERAIRRRPKFQSFEDVMKLKGRLGIWSADRTCCIEGQSFRFQYKGKPAPLMKEGRFFLILEEDCHSSHSVQAALLRLLSTKASSPLKTTAYPSNWDMTALPDIGHQLVMVSETSSEYTDLLNMFKKTLSGQKMKKIWRVQNPSLWQVYQWQKEQMKKVKGGSEVDERQLFHGTDKAYLTAICHQNFDWRICGMHGTLYGQGSYFARDASYSHNYSNPTGGIRSMFVARVLVGDYLKGDPALKRPPYKRGSTTQSYDSCVDDLFHPSIFVVFEKHQIYPEYVLEYEAEKKSCCIS